MGDVAVAAVGVVAEGVLGAEVVGHVLEREGEIGLLSDFVESAAGVGGELDEGVFATGVTAGVGFDRNDDERVDRRAGALSGFERRGVGAVMGGVFAVGDEDDDAAGIGRQRRIDEALAGEGDGVVERGGVAVMDVAERGVDAAGIAGEGGELGDGIGEGDDGDAFVLALERVEEGAGGGTLEMLVGSDALAGVDGKDDVERGGGGLVEEGDALRAVVFGELEVGGGEVGDGRAVVVGDVEGEGDEAGFRDGELASEP